MTEIAQTYLGNGLQDEVLKTRVEQSRDDRVLEVFLSREDNLKSRIYTTSKEGVAIGLIKERSWDLTEGDVFETDGGTLVLIHLQSQPVMVLRFTNTASNDGLKLIHLGHTLGNHHWPILVTPEKLYVQLVADQELMESTIRQFQIPGLEISYEQRSLDQAIPFSRHHPHP